ncbi:hypothetical protein [Streptomyces nigra]|uniref:hypothetical protein n=1 Tax=Streptomyces nigra TaxID=1827580 RepID=UPI0030D041A1
MPANQPPTGGPRWGDRGTGAGGPQWGERFQVDDRSASGLTNIWLTWTIRNNSSEKSDYSWEWEAVGSDGTRLDNGTEIETAVQPGQTAKGETFTTLKTAQGVKLNITDFERTASY